TSHVRFVYFFCYICIVSVGQCLQLMYDGCVFLYNLSSFSGSVFTAHGRCVCVHLISALFQWVSVYSAWTVRVCSLNICPLSVGQCLQSMEGGCVFTLNFVPFSGVRVLERCVG